MTITIEKAAVRHRSGVIAVERPGRHHDCFRKLAEMYPDDLPITGEQGFVTSHGQFVDRKEAARIALASGQITKLHAPPNLYSEDLW